MGPPRSNRRGLLADHGNVRPPTNLQRRHAKRAWIRAWSPSERDRNVRCTTMLIVRPLSHHAIHIWRLACCAGLVAIVPPGPDTATVSAAPERDTAVTVQQSGRGRSEPALHRPSDSCRTRHHGRTADIVVIQQQPRGSGSPRTPRSSHRLRRNGARAGGRHRARHGDRGRTGWEQGSRLIVSFHVVEHPETGSRATIRSAVATWESEPPAKGKIYPEVRVERGQEVTVTLRAPLVVRIPVK